jgi:hypothetical protein
MLKIDYELHNQRNSLMRLSRSDADYSTDRLSTFVSNIFSLNQTL